MAPNQLPDLNRPPQEDEQLTHKVQEQQEEEENQNEKQSEQQAVPESESPQDEEEQEENQNEKQSKQQTVPESESPQDEEEVVKDTTCVSDDQTMTTPCVPNPTPTTPPPPTPTTRDPPHPHCLSHPDKYCGFETLFFGSYSDTHFGSPAASGFITEPSCEPMEDVVSPQPEKPTSSKRRLMPVFGKNADESREKRKAKAVAVEEEAAKKKKKLSAGAATRVWSEEDEVVILKGLMNFQPKKGSDSCQDQWGELYELIKKSLSDDFSKSQFTDKIYKLRRKYRKNAYRGERADEHEHECFELSKRIWGGGGRAMSTRARKTVKQLNKSVALPEENGKEVAWKELEKKWQIWSADEAALRLRLDELIEEQKKLMFDSTKAFKGSKVL